MCLCSIIIDYDSRVKKLIYILRRREIDGNMFVHVFTITIFSRATNRARECEATIAEYSPRAHRRSPFSNACSTVVPGRTGRWAKDYQRNRASATGFVTLCASPPLEQLISW